MERKWGAVTVVAVAVFAWGVVMALVGQAAAIVTAAPVLALTVQQISRAIRPQTAPASGHRVSAVPDREEGRARDESA
ncbi:hypothetical protein AQJ23_00125 [Streptomyces antibioticus]|nr:hypothetical protein [Streptomyces antibioticus]KUN30272.1 hypothetical protein AQJ23_00125 [Streptomyces antibioticus]